MANSNTSIIELLNSELDFIADIEKCIKAGGEIIDCVIDWCHEKNVEFEQIVPLIKGNQVFKSKMTYEAEELHFIKKKPRLKV